MAAEATMSLSEFCKKLSKTDKRVELIAGFHHYMSKVKKVSKATAAQLQTDYKEFCNAPA